MDIWSIITGLASILSLVLYIFEKQHKWGKYLLPCGAFFFGFALSRVTMLFTPLLTSSLQDPALLGLLGILIICLGAMYIFIRMIKEALAIEGIFWIIFIVGSLWAISSICGKYLETTKRQLRPVELIEFASYKESKGDLSAASHYLNIALPAAEDSLQRCIIKGKLLDLYRQQQPIDRK